MLAGYTTAQMSCKTRRFLKSFLGVGYPVEKFCLLFDICFVNHCCFPFRLKMHPVWQAEKQKMKMKEILKGEMISFNK